jgi:dUTP pyrophosphatase
MNTESAVASSTQVLIKRLHEQATLPKRHSEHAAGMDLAACLPDGQVQIEPGTIAMIPCGFSMAVPVGFEAQVRPRSGLATKHGVTLANSPGTIDSDYRGEAFVPLINLGRDAFIVEHGMRIAQMVIAPVLLADAVEVDSLDETARGVGGFGSTGL